MSKTRKYEGELPDAPFTLSLSTRPGGCAINRSVVDLIVLFILAAGSFSEMFTTYSHPRRGFPRQRA
jgi:hypothetical protein